MGHALQAIFDKPLKRNTMFVTIRLLAVCGALMVGATAARADDIKPVGALAALQIHSTSADDYLQFHGRIFVKNSDGSLAEYRWGGTSCGLRLLTADQVAALQRGLDNKRILIEPRSQTGQGDLLCLVGFNLVLKPYLDLVIP
jgi:hypothetical protein